MIGKQRLKSIILMKEKRLFLLIFSIFITFIISISNTYLKAEDSDLKEMVDSQGNVYRVDEQGKIYTDGLPHPERQAATIENLSYYFNQSMALEGNGYLEEAMQMYYEILSLPKVNQSVVITRVAISARIKRVYADTSKRDLVLKYFDVKKLGEGDAIQYKNDKFKFSFRYPSSWQISKEVIEDKQRKVAYISLMAPALLDNEGSVVDVSLGLLVEDISSYGFLGKIQPSQYADIWYKKMPNYIRTEKTILDSGGIKNKFTAYFKGNNYYGEEVFWVKNGIGYYLTFTAGPLFLFELTKDYFYKILATIELK